MHGQDKNYSHRNNGNVAPVIRIVTGTIFWGIFQ